MMSSPVVASRTLPQLEEHGEPSEAAIAFATLAVPARAAKVVKVRIAICFMADGHKCIAEFEVPPNREAVSRAGVDG